MDEAKACNTQMVQITRKPLSQPITLYADVRGTIALAKGSSINIEAIEKN